MAPAWSGWALTGGVCAHAQVGEVAEEEPPCAGGLNRRYSSSSNEGVTQPPARDISRLSSAGTAACRLADAFEGGEEPKQANAGARSSLPRW